MQDVERRLAAILAIDVVGFSRMMGSDETGTLQRLMHNRANIIDAAISANHGRIVKLMGDGMLVEFDSAVNAVQCAIDIQRQLFLRNNELPEAEQMSYRMGINLGDVIVEGDDIYGDGVNIASRLESMADSGGIFISASVQDSVQNKVSATLEDLGERQLKNIDHPVRVYRVDIAGIESSSSSDGKLFRTRRWVAFVLISLAVTGGVLFNMSSNVNNDKNAISAQKQNNQSSPVEPAAAKSGKPTIAVLPFVNFSDDKSQEYFSDGMTEDLITDISKISGISVIARNSTFSYKGQAPDVRDVGTTLGASHVIEGSVRKVGNTVRITVQLIDAVDGHHIWAERYDRELKEIFAIQDEVIGHIITALSLKLTSDEKELLARGGTESLEAYDYYLKGLEMDSFFTLDNNREAISLYEKAIDFDPSYAAAYAHLAQVYSLSVENSWTDKPEIMKKLAIEMAEKAIELDDKLPYAYWSLGRIKTRSYVSDLEGGISAFKKSIELNPNYADGLMFLGLSYIFSGNAEKSFSLIEKAMRINPEYPFWYILTLGMAQFSMANYEAAVKSFDKAIERNPAVPFMYRWLISSYGHLGMIDDAEWMVTELESLGQPATIRNIMKVTSLKDPVYRKVFEEGLRKAGLTED